MTALSGSYRGPSTAELFLDGRPITVRNPREAVARGICMVPEDRKAHGIVPGMGVGQNITLSVLESYAGPGLIDAHRESQDIAAAIGGMRIKTASPAMPIARLSGIPSFIVTLAGLLAFRGILLGITGGVTVTPISADFVVIGQSYLPAPSASGSPRSFSPCRSPRSSAAGPGGEHAICRCRLPPSISERSSRPAPSSPLSSSS